MQDAYEYRLPGRRPATLFGVSASAGLLVIAAIGAAPWYIWAVWSAVFAALVWAVWRNPVHGCRLDGTHFTWSGPRGDTSIPIAGIEAVELTEWSNGPDTCRICLKDGTTRDPPSICLPPGSTFRRVLEDHDIPVTRL